MVINLYLLINTIKMAVNYRKYPPKEIFISFQGREATEEERWLGVEGGIIYHKKTGVELLDCMATLVRRHMCHSPGFYAEELGTGVTELSSCMKILTGLTTTEWIESYVMLCAADLLDHTNYSLGEIGQLVGYVSLKTFSRAFGNYYRMPPSQWRRR